MTSRANYCILQPRDNPEVHTATMDKKARHALRPARLKPNVTIQDIPESDSDALRESSATIIRGKALIFWDPKNPDKKRDAIDTDQITPARDCVSESLDALDKNWKDGAFRYLMPEFRDRVHGGETFLIAGDRFAIGSSREMSPAGRSTRPAPLHRGTVCKKASTSR